jgi:hypothetical protein
MKSFIWLENPSHSMLGRMQIKCVMKWKHVL